MRGRSSGLGFVLVVSAAVVVSGCDAVLGRHGSIVLQGTGSGTSAAQDLPAGRYEATWAIRPGDDPDAVCWFELALASSGGVTDQLAYLTATSGGTSGDGVVEFHEPTTVAVQAQATDCGPWMVSVTPLAEHALPVPSP